MNTMRATTSATTTMFRPFRRAMMREWMAFLAALAPALTVPALAETPAGTIRLAGIGALATAGYQSDGLGATPSGDSARLSCGFQQLEAHATPEGLSLESSAPGGGNLRLVATAMCRQVLECGSPLPLWKAPPPLESGRGLPHSKTLSRGSSRLCASVEEALAATGVVSVQGRLVQFTRPGLTEEYSVSLEGLRQDFVIGQRPAGAGHLRIELTLSGARAEAKGHGVKLTFDSSGRALAYSRLRVVDAAGRDLPGCLEVQSADRVVVWVADTHATYPVRIDPTFSDADWMSLGSGVGGNDTATVVYALAASETNLYVGGFFSTAGGIWANNIAKWDGSAWWDLGGVSGVIAGITPSVFAVAATRTDLYVGGNFSMAGGVSATNIAKWDGSAWSALGPGIPGSVRALAVEGTDLYAASGGRVAKWNGTSWSDLGSGMSGGPNPGVYALAVNGSNVYAGGWFTTAGGVTVNGIARWNGSAWSALGSGMSGAGSIVEALAVSGTDLYAGGYFTYAGDVGAMYIARWDGSVWSPVGSGMNGSVSSLAVSGTDLFAGGQFTTAGGLPAWYIAKWNGWTWSALGSGLGGTSYPNAQALAADGAGRLFVGGNFGRAGTKSCSCVAQANVGLSVPTVPVIVSPPTNQNVLIGGEAEFSVVAWSTTLMGYQWFFGSHGIPGATNTVLQLTNVQPSQAGVYTVVITNVYGATTSAPAALGVFPPRTVADASEAALRAAMVEGENITFACDGTITLSSAITNSLDVKLDATGHQVTISGANRVGVFVVNTNVSFALANLTVSGGASAGGSAILNLGGIVNLTSVAFLSNSATGTYPSNLTANGGAIWNRGGTVHITNCSFLGNASQTLPTLSTAPTDVSALGGAIRNEAGEMNLQGCTFIGNRASGAAAYNPSMRPNPGQGGAIHNSGTLTVDLCTFACNSAAGGDGSPGMSPYLLGGPGAPGGGGAISCQGALKVDRTTFSANSATGGRGGMGAMGDAYGYPDGSPGGDGAEASGGAVSGSGLFSRSLFVSNVVTAGAGGPGGSGFFHVDIGGNGARGGRGASSSGGAVSGSGSLVNCTIAFNTSYGGQGGGGGGGAGFVGGLTGNGANGGDGGSAVGGVAGTCSLTNCTVVGNLGQAGAGGWGGSSMGGKQGMPGVTGSANGGTECGSMPNTLVASNTPAGGDTFPDPKLGPLTDNGGPTLTMALLPGSPAIDAGNMTLAPATDQRGVQRPFGFAADVGAFEFWPTLQVSRSGAAGINILASGISGQACRLLASTNSSNWAPIATNQIGSAGTVLFYDTCPPARTCRFYRLVMP